VELSEAASISSLCATFNNLQANLPQLPLGYLSFSGTTTSNQRFLVQITASGQERAPRKTISVEEFIRTSLGSGQFGTRDKLEFALALASSLLWLYSTPWLKALWTSRDILLLQNRGAIDRYSYGSRTFSMPSRGIQLCMRSLIQASSMTQYSHWG
jgi:hypothetical protein